MKQTIAPLSLALLAAAVAQDSGNEARPPGLLLWESATAEELPASPELIARGKAVYEVRCVTCHGKKGDGEGPASVFLSSNPPRDFTRGVYKFRTTPQEGMPADMDLFRSITVGFPAYGMPSFRYLCEEDRWALVHYVKSLYPKWEQFGKPEVVTISREPPEEPGAVERGKELYEKKYKCLDCHGAEGHGDGERAAELKDFWNRPISPRDFTLGPAFLKGGWRHEDTVRMLVTGAPGTPMPSQVDQLADPKDLREFWRIARYVEHLTQKAQRK